MSVDELPPYFFQVHAYEWTERLRLLGSDHSACFLVGSLFGRQEIPISHAEAGIHASGRLTFLKKVAQVLLVSFVVLELICLVPLFHLVAGVDDVPPEQVHANGCQNHFVNHHHFSKNVFAPALFGPVLSPLSIAQKNTRI
ncbi:hypothetical protein [Hallerella porci]|uniref:hypothetical protein n=1 Tax=Hallerella porci TaxID=1945871 RepID=UPI0011B20888|nr:hypothetical protein [Hallerella porci]